MINRKWLVTGGVTLGIILALMLGYAIGRSVDPGTVPVASASAATPGDDSAEAGFARDMSTHHAQAVDMSMIAAAKATNPNVRQLGYDIALTQENQIGIMQTWLKDWGLDPTGTQPKMAWMPEGTAALKDGLMPGMATQDQMRQLQSASGKQVDILYLKLILAHHLGGIHMVDGVLAKTTDPDVKELAENMKAGQQKEITVVQDLLKDLGAA
ncbi:DUF305 domain-containing protein [Hamadaea tsunoensis]|uniref:DUF305 domain-containing protein n=1 Tax=Hamadaea tsunoensis TaxID=53368 RepID=UPI000420B826|nr:DUF305 domain-containing protein [Hamadaea tsunoensis]